MTKQTLTPHELASLLTTLPAGAKLDIEKSPAGDIIVNGQAKSKSQLIAEKYAHLVGVGISFSQAAKKYGVPSYAIRRWVYRSGEVSFVDEDAYPRLVDEAEVALCADIYKVRKKAGTSGLPYFDAQGYLIEEVKRPASSRNKP